MSNKINDAFDGFKDSVKIYTGKKVVLVDDLDPELLSVYPEWIENVLPEYLKNYLYGITYRELELINSFKSRRDKIVDYELLATGDFLDGSFSDKIAMLKNKYDQVILTFTKYIIDEEDTYYGI